MKRYIGWFVKALALVLVFRHPLPALVITLLYVAHWAFTRIELADDEILTVIGASQWKASGDIVDELRRLKSARWWGRELASSTVYSRLSDLVRGGDLESRSTAPSPERSRDRGGRNLVEYRLTGSGSRRRVAAERLQPDIDTDLITIN